MRKLWVLLLTFALAACSSAPEKDGVPVLKERPGSGVAGDALIESSIADAINLIPAISSDSASHAVAGYIYNGLVKYDKNLNLTGDLAERWDVSDDKKKITFYLRKDAFWHDGVPFTAKDVEFTFKMLIDPKTPTPYDSDFKRVQALKVVDNYTVEVTYPDAYAPALNGWGMWIMPAHLLAGQEVTKSPLQRKPVGTGPYMFEDWKPGESITLKAFPAYFEGRPNIEKVVTRVIPDQATTFMELLAGNLDISTMTPLQYTRQTSDPKFTGQFNKYSYLANAYTYIGYNLKKPMFADKRVRQALSYATPQQQIINTILFGLGEPATGPYKPGTVWHNPNVKRYDYNLEKAKALLKEAGWADTNADGILDKDGAPFAFELITNQGNTLRSQIAEIVQQSWAQLGIKVEIRVLEWATFLNEYINKGNFSATILGWNILQEPDLFDVWHSSTCGKNNLNFICYQNPEVDQLILGGQQEYDPEKRAAFYHKVQEILAEEQPYTFLYIPQSLVAISNRVRGIEPAPAGLSHNQIHWDVPAEKQKYKFQQ